MGSRSLVFVSYCSCSFMVDILTNCCLSRGAVKPITLSQCLFSCLGFPFKHLSVLCICQTSCLGLSRFRCELASWSHLLQNANLSVLQSQWFPHGKSGGSRFCSRSFLKAWVQGILELTEMLGLPSQNCLSESIPGPPVSGIFCRGRGPSLKNKHLENSSKLALLVCLALYSCVCLQTCWPHAHKCTSEILFCAGVIGGGIH